MITTREELGLWLRLTQAPGIGPETIRRLLATWGLPAQILQQDAAALRQVLSARQTQSLLTEPADWAALLADTWDWLQAAPARGPQRAVVCLGDADYPAPLLDTADPPILLYALGQTAWLPRLQATQAIAIVGSRNPTPQGLVNARAFAQALASSGLTVVSGLALGVDGAAHEGAFDGALDGAPEGRLPTVALVGTGLDRVYPKQHLALAHRIAERGLILSEYPMGTPPLNANFPRRNRLISGLAQGTLVVEAALKSGSLITAREALDQGREVFAIPGSIHSPQAKGCHALIKQGAKLVESAQDVLEELRLPEPLAQAPLALDAPTEDDLHRALGHDPVSLDALQARCGWNTARLQAQLLELELLGQVARLPGGLFQRLTRA